MTMITLLAHVGTAGGASGGSALASWRPFTLLMTLFGAAVVALFVLGRGPLLLRIPNGLERLIRVPGWAASTVGLSLFGLLVAGQGFYSDVAWHVALGRDKELFTAPHTAILVGLALIFASGFVGILVATLQRVDTSIRLGRNRGIRVPWSTLPLIALGSAAVSGFPLDELWHAAYGIDVTMWSPTHMLMILGAASTGMAGWLVFSEAGVDPKQNRWSLGVHVFAAWLTLQGLSAPLGEFAFGVPQFQQMFHPVLVSVAAGFALVAMRLVLGPRWALGIAVVNFLLLQADLLSAGSDDSPVETRMVGLYVVSAVVVETVAWLLGTRHRARFAFFSGVGIGTVGLAGEWLWNLDAYQPWRTTLLPDAVVLSVIAATGAAFVATAFARAAGHQLDAAPVPRRLVALGGLAVIATIVLPLPRTTGDVEATMRLRPVNDHDAHVEVTLDPPDAADEARWFQASAWQGGGLVLSDMKELAPGRYVSEEPVPVSSGWKTILRLHRGSELMTVPIYLPADPEIDEPEIPAVDRTQGFEKETEYLLRETHAGSAWFAYVIHGLLVAAIALWITSFCVAVAKLAPARPAEARRDLVTST